MDIRITFGVVPARELRAAIVAAAVHTNALSHRLRITRTSTSQFWHAVAIET